MQDVRKRFGPVIALEGVNLSLRPGEIRGLLGGNGAGKTTLMNVLYGLYKGDSGRILVDGQPVVINSPKDAINSGIGMVHQQFLQVNRFTVTENIVLGTKLKNRPALSLHEEKEHILDLSRQFGLPVDPEAVIQDLPMGVRQRVEILKALYRGVKILVLDEPTTNLTPQEVDDLFDSLRKMVQEGLSIIFITHKLREVLELCETVTVLRHGRDVLTVAREEASEETFVKSMVGEDMMIEGSLVFSGESQSTSGLETGRPILQLNNVSVGQGPVPGLNACSFTLHAGEILGVAGVAGNGQIELVESILGLRPKVSGQVEIKGIEGAELDTNALFKAGVAYIPEDRWLDGFLPSANVAQNLILGLQRQPPYSDGRLLNWRVIDERARSLIDEFNIMTQGPDELAGNLSGGNIQRLMLARAFSRPIRLLIAHNPTRGLDIPSIEFVYGRLLEQQKKGMATLLISENMDELFLLSNRIVALCNGEIMGFLEPEQFDRYRLGRMMSGVRSGE